MPTFPCLQFHCPNDHALHKTHILDNTYATL